MQYVSLLEVLLAAAVSLIAGFLWYSPIFFGNKWQKEMELAKEENQRVRSKNLTPSADLAYLSSFVGDLITATVLLSLIGYSGLDNYTVAIIAWLGFMMPVLFAEGLYGKMSWTLFFLNGGFRLVSLLLMATVFTFF